MSNEKRMFRPKYLDQFIGQNLIRKNLKVFIKMEEFIVKIF